MCSLKNVTIMGEKTNILKTAQTFFFFVFVYIGCQTIAFFYECVKQENNFSINFSVDDFHT